tara:strand:- start:63 stop:218 length:156 start_codon:yes stop_codon:yes gene_type:complete
MKQVFACEYCESDCIIKHDMDEEYYNILYCPFCGKEFTDDNYQDEIEDNDY